MKHTDYKELIENNREEAINLLAKLLLKNMLIEDLSKFFIETTTALLATADDKVLYKKFLEFRIAQQRAAKKKPVMYAVRAAGSKDGMIDGPNPSYKEMLAGFYNDGDELGLFDDDNSFFVLYKWVNGGWDSVQ